MEVKTCIIHLIFYGIQGSSLLLAARSQLHKGKCVSVKRLKEVSQPPLKSSASFGIFSNFAVLATAHFKTLFNICVKNKYTKKKHVKSLLSSCWGTETRLVYTVKSRIRKKVDMNLVTYLFLFVCIDTLCRLPFIG